MDRYVRDFQTDTITTYSLDTTKKCNEILKISDNNVNFKILYTNIRSVNNNFDEFLILIDNLRPV